MDLFSLICIEKISNLKLRRVNTDESTRSTRKIRSSLGWER
ncbi:MAG: hypothetical protein BAJALOKI3v1_20017 [Promethearchaeota archaeon]|nr:MAG: hypothetical protein BAJALOKI3v1_20017 [Candidatus Lokiarchaeota archaeon]